MMNVCRGVDPHQSSPPPAAGVAATAAAVPDAAEGDALTELFGLNKSPMLNLAGDADATGLAAACAFVRARLALGEAAGDGDSAGLATVAASVFLRPRFVLGESRRRFGC